ncbi:hypothetical protein NDU88_005835 [Pleurodeles waltl]|uniref:Uncharacterized protein n=1 Tax=Pleurodeles waltl TaxID=8319 RepID=A0AAV7QGX4_PLEWA|nr:hypothetical protein NDU88_005835 [Pleurodeles waltl]
MGAASPTQKMDTVDDKKLPFSDLTGVDCGKEGGQAACRGDPLTTATALDRPYIAVKYEGEIDYMFFRVSDDVSQCTLELISE